LALRETNSKEERKYMKEKQSFQELDDQALALVSGGSHHFSPTTIHGNGSTGAGASVGAGASGGALGIDVVEAETKTITITTPEGESISFAFGVAFGVAI
jgi:hypothetical protein